MGKALACTAMTKSRITSLLPAGFRARTRPGCSGRSRRMADPLARQDSRSRQSQFLMAPSPLRVGPTGSGASLTPHLRVALLEPDIPQNTGTDSSSGRMSRRRGAYHRTGGLSHHRPRLPAGRHGLSRSGGHRTPSELEGLRDMAQHRLRAVDPVHHARPVILSRPSISARRRPAVRPGIVSAGEKVHEAADARLVIPMRTGLRSLNVAMAAAMAVGEAMRQIASSGAEAVARADVQKARGG